MDGATNNDEEGGTSTQADVLNQPDPTTNVETTAMNEPTDISEPREKQPSTVEVGASNGNDEGEPSSNSDKPTLKKHWSVKETPKWRFVAKAKKTEGYSSTAAGPVIQGK